MAANPLHFAHENLKISSSKDHKIKSSLPQKKEIRNTWTIIQKKKNICDITLDADMT